MNNITLEQAAEKAHQAEIICLLMESFPHKFADSEITAISSLLSKLTGDVSAFLISNLMRQENDLPENQEVTK